MMTNLFSMFDPSSTLNLPLNWISIIMVLIFIPSMFWLMPNSINLIYTKMMTILFNEFSIIINKPKNNNFTLIFISLFLFIMMNNFIGLFPYIFTGTSHLTLNLTMALPLWLSFLMFGWLNKTNHMFSHLVPQGTPILLIPFMVCIETISNIIRPITLTVRLTANMIAGHLLLTLLGNMGPLIPSLTLPLLLMIQMMLLSLETAVAIIQSYVFSVLLTLYVSEI